MRATKNGKGKGGANVKVVAGNERPGSPSVNTRARNQSIDGIR